MAESKVENNSCFTKFSLKKRIFCFLLFLLGAIIFNIWSWSNLFNKENNLTCFWFVLGILLFWTSTLFIHSFSYSISLMKEKIILLFMLVAMIVSIVLVFICRYLADGNIVLYFIFVASGTAAQAVYLWIAFPMTRIFCCCCLKDDDSEKEEVEEEATKKNLV
jgi:hypothetical protein